MNTPRVRRAAPVLLCVFLFAIAGGHGPATLLAVDTVCPIHAPIVWRNSVSGQNIGWLMNGLARSNSAFLPTIADVNWKVQGVGDFNGDGQGDVFFRNTSTGQNIAWLMNALVVSVSAFLPTIADTNWNVVAVGDLNGDGKSDVVWRNGSTGQNIGWLMNGLTVSTSAFLPTIADTNWKVQGSGDFDGNGRSDVFLRNTSTGQNIGWLMNGLVVSASAFLPTEANTNWNVVGVGDVSGDGRADLVWRNGSTGQNIGWLMNGLTVSNSAFLPTIADTNWKVFGVAELNRDGKADVVFRNTSTGQNIGWLMNGLVVSVSAFLPTEADTNWAIVGVFGTTRKPVITNVAPNAGSGLGGQSFTISGLYQNCATSVTVGGTAATISTTDFGVITATTGAHAAGTVDVVVTTSRGSTTSAGAYTYLPFGPPAFPTGIPNITTSAGVPGTANFTAADPDNLNAVTFSASSSNTAVVPNGNIVFGGSGANRTVTVTPAVGAIGSAVITVTANDGAGTAQTTFTVTIPSLPPLVGAPQNFHVIAYNGNNVTFGWTLGAGQLAPTGHVLEGGISPGDVAASIPTGSASPQFTITAPTGAFYVRLKTVSGANVSAASNEIRIFVNVPAPPSDPANLLGMANGSLLALSWKNTSAGGPPSLIRLTVAGSLAVTLDLPGAPEYFTYPVVPGGTYTFTVTAINATGASAPSNPVTLSFPAACTGPPQAPTSFQATRSGNVITVGWDVPLAGPAVTRYVLDVTGSFVGSFPTTTRTLAGAVAPGSYTLSVRATNGCGNGPSTAPVIVTVP